MTTRPERFRVKALECYVAAQKAKDPATRDAYLELMQNWRDLADEIERFEHAWLDREGPLNDPCALLATTVTPSCSSSAIHDWFDARIA